MSETLYSRDILRLAMTLGDDAPLADADGRAELRSPVCGSTATLLVKTDNGGRVEAISVALNACAIGQASAAILKRRAEGMDAPALAKLRAEIAAFLKGDGEMPDVWEELSALANARDYPARHGALLLPFDALLAAIADAQEHMAA